MSSELTLFERPADLPAEVATFLDEETNIPPKQTVPSLSYEGKTWTISLEGEKTKLMRKNADGESEPITTFSVIILDWNKRRGRSYYEGAYDPNKPLPPVCWSEDGVKPHDSITDPQCATCAKCPMSVKGSKVTEQGKAVVACSEHRMIVVVPASKPEFQPLRMKLAQTSDWDGQSSDQEAQGWYAFKNYTDMLRARGVDHTAEIVTKMRFDPDSTWPKVMFKADKRVDTPVLIKLIPVIKGDEVKKLMAGGWTPAGVDGEKIEKAEAPDLSVKTEAELVAEVKAAKEKATAEKAAKKAATDAKAAAEAAVAARKSTEEGDEGVILPGEEAAPAATSPKEKATPKAGKAAAPKTEPAATSTDAQLEALMHEWTPTSSE
jgi:hypothetical protein